MNSPAKFVYCLHWDEGKFAQMCVFDDIEAARDFADYLKASRGVGSILHTNSVYGKSYVSQVTGKEYA